MVPLGGLAAMRLLAPVARQAAKLLAAVERALTLSRDSSKLFAWRETAADGLADTRRFIRELTPPSLDQGLGAALRRLAEQQWTRDGLTVEVDVPAGMAAYSFTFG